MCIHSRSQNVNLDYSMLNEIYEAIRLNDTESAVNLTNELIKLQTDESRVKYLQEFISNLS